MKSIKIMAAAIALCGMTACGDNTPKTFTGFITDASMNTVTVENAEEMCIRDSHWESVFAHQV